MRSMLSLDAARAAVLAAAGTLPIEQVPLAEALGRVLAEDVVSKRNLPPFASSAMDGYAVGAGPPRTLRLVDEARAGRPARSRVEGDTAIAISTGAAIPAGADAVVPIERAAADGTHVRVPETAVGANVRAAGEDLRVSDLALAAGAELGPAELALLASLGHPTAICHRRPRLSIAVTGDELVEPGTPLGAGQIYDSNAVALSAQARLAGAEVVGRAAVRDDPERTRGALADALAGADVVCVSGGVSVGPHDHVKAALEALGVTQRFWRVALKPGKPVWFGTRGETLVFGLPGNPVSAMVTFQLLVRPALRALQGSAAAEARALALLDEPVARSPERTQALRCHLRSAADGWHVAPTGPQGSHIVTSMAAADALAIVPAGEGRLEAGERVEVELLRR